MRDQLGQCKHGQLDGARAAAASDSELMRALHDVIGFISECELVDLSPVLGERLGGTLALPTRTATAQFVTRLCLQRAVVLAASRAQAGSPFRRPGNASHIL